LQNFFPTLLPIFITQYYSRVANLWVAVT
jgi:hypothetical protein